MELLGTIQHNILGKGREESGKLEKRQNVRKNRSMEETGLKQRLKTKTSTSECALW